MEAESRYRSSIHRPRDKCRPREVVDRHVMRRRCDQGRRLHVESDGGSAQPEGVEEVADWRSAAGQFLGVGEQRLNQTGIAKIGQDIRRDVIGEDRQACRVSSG